MSKLLDQVSKETQAGQYGGFKIKSMAGYTPKRIQWLWPPKWSDPPVMITKITVSLCIFTQPRVSFSEAGRAHHIISPP